MSLKKRKLVKANRPKNQFFKTCQTARLCQTTKLFQEAKTVKIILFQKAKPFQVAIKLTVNVLQYGQ
ncbi:MAG: hypothetical protein CVT92_17215 [Bacteroidetes bacterium HGW-Bacteroidetes-1]|nr:MAG: hypothetical protein CVT92_17215 [Bacteroidetes bacterium HGW-Bacteroidetes-1]